jgi:hypothetical protein
MIPTLNALRAARLEAERLKATIAELEAPYREAMAAATGELRALARELEDGEQELAAAASVQYLEAEQRRAMALAAGEEAPRTALPPGCSVRWLSAPVVTAAAELPRAVLVPDSRLLRAALVEAGGTIPGAEMQQHPTFAWRSPAGHAKK